MFSYINIVKKKLKLKSYTGNIIEPLGYITDKVTYGLKKESLSWLKNVRSPLLGCTWISQLNLQIMSFHNMTEIDIDEVASLLRAYPEIFVKGLGTFRSRIQL